VDAKAATKLALQSRFNLILNVRSINIAELALDFNSSIRA
jgi:hypothetical protein